MIFSRTKNQNSDGRSPTPDLCHLITRSAHASTWVECHQLKPWSAVRYSCSCHTENRRSEVISAYGTGNHKSTTSAMIESLIARTRVVNSLMNFLMRKSGRRVHASEMVVALIQGVADLIHLHITIVQGLRSLRKFSASQRFSHLDIPPAKAQSR